MNILLDVPTFSLNKSFNFPLYLSGTILLHEHRSITSFILCFWGSTTFSVCDSFSLGKIISQFLDEFVFPEKEKQS